MMMRRLLSIGLCMTLLSATLPAVSAEEAQPTQPGEAIVVEDNGTHSYVGSVEVTDRDTAVSVSGGATVSIAEGSISASNVSAPAVLVTGSTLELTGDESGSTGSISASADALQASKGAEVSVAGDVTSKNGDAVLAFSESTVTVEGCVVSGDDGVTARPGTSLMEVMKPGATVTVGGSILSDEEGITAQNSTVIVDGSVSAGRDGSDSFRSDVLVHGDLTADRIGAGVMVNSLSSADDVLLVEGTLSGTEYALAIMDYTPIPFMIKNAQEANLPTVVVGKLESDGELLQAVTVQEADLTTFEIKSFTENATLTELMAARIGYIVSADETVTTDASGSFTAPDGTAYVIAHEGDSILVTPVAKNGYRVKGIRIGDYAECVDNGDGTYTVTVQRGGDLVFSAILKRLSSGGKKTATKAASWRLEKENEDGTAELISTGRFPEERLADLQALLREELTEEQLALLCTDEDGMPLVRTEDGYVLIVTKIGNVGAFTAREALIK